PACVDHGLFESQNSRGQTGPLLSAMALLPCVLLVGPVDLVGGHALARDHPESAESPTMQTARDQRGADRASARQAQLPPGFLRGHVLFLFSQPHHRRLPPMILKWDRPRYARSQNSDPPVNFADYTLTYPSRGGTADSTRYTDRAIT